MGMYVYCIDMYIHTCVCVCVCIHTHTHTQIHMSASGIVIHYIGWGCQSPNPQEIQWFKWEFCVWFVWQF